MTKQLNTPASPPNFREVDCCSNCVHISFEYDSCDCDKYPETSITESSICDDYKNIYKSEQQE